MPEEYVNLKNAKKSVIRWYEWIWLWLLTTYVIFGDEKVVLYKKVFGKVYVVKIEDYPFKPTNS